MPTPVSDKEAKRAAARAGLARAKQWRDNNLGKSTPTKTAHTPKRPSSKKSPVPKRSQDKLEKETMTTKASEGLIVQYRKTPSREDRAQARARALSNAREWNSQRKKKLLKLDAKVDENKAGVPAVVETNRKIEFDDLSVSDDFKTAPGTEPKANVEDEAMFKELSLAKSDVKNAFNRLQDICDDFDGKIDAVAMECD